MEAGRFVLPSPAEIDEAKTQSGGWTAMTLALWGVSWPPPRGWRKNLHDLWSHKLSNETTDTRRTEVLMAGTEDQHAPSLVTNGMLVAWAAVADAHIPKLGEVNWTWIVRSLIAEVYRQGRRNP